MSPRTRIAPSPTGAPHIGTAYAALFNWCLARAGNGQFILRIEDTDRARSSAHAERQIISALRWLGLDWDEGPDVGGDCGPYRQSDRAAIYREHIERLLADGHAFRCFASAEELAAMRAEQMRRGETPRYDGRGLRMADAESRRRAAAKEPHVVRMKVPDAGDCVIADALRGEVRIDYGQVDMSVLLKSDGMPSYHLASVVDDHLMEITHVLRGEEWISSAPKHLLLYQYFGWTPPTLCHLPLLRNPDQSKLSKRRNPAGIGYYREQGYLPEALLNYLARMGWNMPDGREQFSLQDMAEVFALADVGKGAPVFDLAKLDWLNGQWLRGLSADALAERVSRWLADRQVLPRLLPHAQTRIAKFSELAAWGACLYADGAQPSAAELDAALERADGEPVPSAAWLQMLLWRLENMSGEAWREPELLSAALALADALGIARKQAFRPLFIAITGSESAIPVAAAMEILGPELSMARLREALAALGGLSKKQAKAWQRAYRALPATPQ